MDSSSSQFGGCGHTCVNSSNGYKGEIKRKLYPTRDGRKVAALHLSSQRALFVIWKTGVAFGSKGMVFNSGLMTKAGDGSSGRSHMMRKSHVRFPENGVATYWSFDQPPSLNSALGPPLTLSLL
ncbi:hypothetical protein HN51_048030 [Arachis hypogaea]